MDGVATEAVAGEMAENEPREDLLTSPSGSSTANFPGCNSNRRVAEETLNTAHPLLERVRFLSISAANLDEFFMVRVRVWKARCARALRFKSPDGRTPAETA